MAVVIYLSDKATASELIADAVRSAAGGTALLTCPRPDDILPAIAGRLSEIDALIIAPGDQRELDGLLPMADMLCLVPCIVILPDRTLESIRKGHGLFPRFMTYRDEPVERLVVVLEKMLKNNSRKRGKEE